MKETCKSMLKESCLVIILTLLYLWEGNFSDTGEAGWYAGLYGVSPNGMDYIKSGVWIVPFWCVLVYALRDLQQEFEGRIFFTSIRHASLCTYIKQLLLKTGKRAVGMGSINCVWFIVVCTIQANVCDHLNWINWEHMAKAFVLYILGVLFFSVIMFWIFVFSQSLYWVLGSQIVLFSMLFFITYMPDWGARVLPICWTSLVYSSEMCKEGYTMLVIILLEVFLMGGICFYGTYRCRKRKLKVLR